MRSADSGAIAGAQPRSKSNTATKSVDGETVDLSMNGALVRASDIFSAGSRVEVIFIFLAGIAPDRAVLGAIIRIDRSQSNGDCKLSHMHGAGKRTIAGILVAFRPHDQKRPVRTTSQLNLMKQIRNGMLSRADSGGRRGPIGGNEIDTPEMRRGREEFDADALALVGGFAQKHDAAIPALPA